jgi:hypothetical protein
MRKVPVKVLQHMTLDDEEAAVPLFVAEAILARELEKRATDYCALIGARASVFLTHNALSSCVQQKKVEHKDAAKARGSTLFYSFRISCEGGSGHGENRLL